MTGGGNVLTGSCVENHATPKNSKHQKRVRHVKRHGPHCDEVVLDTLVYVHMYLYVHVRVCRQILALLVPVRIQYPR